MQQQFSMELWLDEGRVRVVSLCIIGNLFTILGYIA